MCVVSHVKCEVGHIWCVCVFQTLQEVSSLHEASYTEAQAQYNQNKNRFPDKLPSEYGLCVHIAPTNGIQYTTMKTIHILLYVSLHVFVHC